MVRTLIGLGQPPAVLKALTSFAVARFGLRVVVPAVLVAYWNLFLRAAQLVSRRQDVDDELAC